MRLDVLRSIREEKHITQEDMARRLGYKDKSSYCHIESGKVKISVDTAYKIKLILKLTQEQYEKIFFNPEVEVY